MPRKTNGQLAARPRGTKLGEFLRAERFKAGLSQAALAAHIGGLQSQIAMWETGRRCPDLVQATRLLGVFGLWRGADLIGAVQQDWPPLKPRKRK